ncbi:oxygen regulatory protein NreC [mine drainage metagenome]|uniref:Oxygen regulatory protein NreC n=1 Tax=mine drainage metagenome TaxID=410659 RepID=A0A1J5PNC1_9ZZZZ
MKDKTRIVLADDHPIVLTGLRNLIESEADFTVVGEATSGPEALRIIREARPDIAIVDISMPGMSGIVLTRRLTEEAPGIKILMLTLHEDRAYLRQALDVGARGYVVKRSAAANLVSAVRSVIAGGTYIDPAIVNRVLNRSPAGNRVSIRETRDLTDRETEVLKLSSLGLTNKEISHRIGVSVKSIETFKSRGLAKLEIQSRADLLRYASQVGWLSDI